MIIDPRTGNTGIQSIDISGLMCTSLTEAVVVVDRSSTLVKMSI